MNPKKKAVAVAVAGSALGVVGLGILAMPAGAGEAPELPQIGAQELIESTLNADVPALSGEVEVTNDIGLPAIPGVPGLDAEAARVFHDGDGNARISVQQGAGEYTFVRNGDTMWTYDPAQRVATKATVAGGEKWHDEAQAPDPAGMTTDLLRELRKYSTVSVDGTAKVAGRAAYELVLTPKPTENTLLREVRVAVDAENRMPLRASVLTNGTTEPAAEIGFSELEFTPQPAELFDFTPPAGTDVTEERIEAPESAKDARGNADKAGQPENANIVGDGWDTVFVTELPAGLNDAAENTEIAPRELLEQMGQRVTGSFGGGYVITTKVGSALVTDDGRLAVGAVPQQILTKALGSK